MRVNMDSSVVTDGAAKELAEELDIDWRLAIGCCYLVWLGAYERESEFATIRKVDIAAEHKGFAEAMVNVDLAERVDDKTIRLRGVKERIKFLKARRRSASKGGQNSGKSRRKKGEAKREANASQTPKHLLPGFEPSTPAPAPSPDPAPSPSPDQSHSRSDPPGSEFDFKAVYDLYPRKRGKKVGLAKLTKKIKNQAAYAAFRVAVQAMAVGWAGHDTKFCPYFSTFVNQELWLDEELPLPSDGKDVSVGRVEPASQKDWASVEAPF